MTMNLPVLFLGIVLSTLYAALFHFWKKGSLKSLVLFLILSWVGFWLGHIAGGMLDLKFGAIGVLNTGMATLGSAAFLFVGEWLSLVNIQKK
jgi:hypothetical protein